MVRRVDTPSTYVPHMYLKNLFRVLRGCETIRTFLPSSQERYWNETFNRCANQKMEAEKQAQFAKDEAARCAAEKQAEADAAANDAELNIYEMSIEDLRVEIDAYDGVCSLENTKEELILILTKCIEEDAAK